MIDEIDPGRRRFPGTAVRTVAAASLGLAASAQAQSSSGAPADPAGTSRGRAVPLGPSKQVDAGDPDVG